MYEAVFSNLGLTRIPVPSSYVQRYDRLLCGGIWCIVKLNYDFNVDDQSVPTISMLSLTPIQMPHIDIEEIKSNRQNFTKNEWIDILIRSTGMV